MNKLLSIIIEKLYKSSKLPAMNSEAIIIVIEVMLSLILIIILAISIKAVNRYVMAVMQIFLQIPRKHILHMQNICDSYIKEQDVLL